MNFLQTIENAFGQMPCVKQGHCKIIPLPDAHDSARSNFALPLLAIAFLSAFLMPSFSWAGDDHRAFPPVLWIPEICNNGIDDDGDGLIDSADPDCTNNCTAPIFDFQNPTLLSGTAGAVGAIYRFSNILPGFDARVTILSRSHSDIVIQSLDEPAATNGGYDGAFQPIIDYNWLNIDGGYDAASGEKSVTFKFDFLQAGTSNLQGIPQLNMTALDIDGSGTEIREFAQTSGFSSYLLQSPTSLTLSGALKAKGGAPGFNGVVETELTAMISYVFDGISSLTVTYGADWNGTPINGEIEEARMNCLFFKCYTFNTTVTCPTVSINGGNLTKCSPLSATLNAVTGNGLGTCNLQWQSSTDNVNWTNIAGATGTSYTTPALSATTYFRATYSCSDNFYCGTIYSNVSVLTTTGPCPEICNNGIDDDGDGLIDLADSDCAPCSTTVFFTETFGTGGRTSTSYTNFCYEDGSGNDCLQFAPSTEINDGEYAIAQAPNPIGGHPTWTYSGDHTGDAGGRMMVVNADLTPGEFYRRTITGVYPNADVTVELWLRNTIMPGYDLLKPNVTFKLLNSSNVVLGSISTGDIPEDNTWKKYSLSLNPGNLTSVKIVLVNNGPGGDGNDLSLDDIVAMQVLTPPAPTLSATCANPTATISVTAPTGANLQYSINGTTYQSSTSFAGVSAGTYNVTVKNATTGCFSPATAITVYNAPTISVQPGGGTICSGSAYNLSVVAANAATYQWQSSTNNVTFTNISGATSSNYNTGNLTSTTYYQVLLNIGTCSLTSGKATVTVQVCPEICDNGLDDDNDGLTDCADPDCNVTGGYATAVTSQTGVTNPNNALGAPNSTFAKLYETGDRLTLDFGTTIPAGGKYVITWRRKSTYSNSAVANLVVEESANNSTFTQNSFKPSTSSKTTFITTTMTSGVPTRYIRLKTNGGNDDDFEIDAVARITCLLEICNNGLDDDGDGLADCADSGCSVSVTASPDVTICPAQTTTLTATADSESHCDEFMQVVAHYTGNVTNPNASLLVPDNVATYLYSVSGNYTRMVYDMGMVHPAGSSICIKVKSATQGVAATFDAWILTSGVPATGGYQNIGTVTTTSATYQDFCFVLPSANRYFKISQTSGGPFYVDAAAYDCDGNGLITYLWSNGTQQYTTNVAPTSTTTYTVTATNTNGCTATDQVIVTVVANPSITTQPVSKNICIGTSHTLSVAATGGTPSLTYQWQSSLTNLVFTNISGATSSTYTTPALLVNTYYRVVVSASSNGCVSVTSNTAAVTVQTCIEICNNGTDDDLDGLVDCADSNCGGIPLLNAGADATICSGSSTTLSASATGGTAPLVYTWSNSLGTGATKTVSPTSTTTYTVTVTSLSGCSATDQVTVTVNPRPTANAGADVTICNTFSTNLTASASGASSPYTYAWSNSLGSGATKTVNPSSTTTYTVTVTSNNGCNNTDQVVVTVQNCVENCGNGLDDDGDGLVDCADSDCKPTPDAGSDVSICPGTTAYLSVGVSGGTGPFTYAWSNGLGSGATKSVSPSSTTTYSVTVTGASGCTGVDQVKVTILNCAENCTNGVDDDSDGLVDCDDPDCAGVTAPVLVNDEYTTCPGMTYSNRVSYNDGNLNNPLFSITSNPAHGSVTIDWTGKFVYVPNSFECATDVFAYQVCNQSSGCCDQATVTIILGDNIPPLLTNVPADLTLSCDDEIPSPPIVTSFDNCPGLFIEYDETSSQNYVGACGSYTITRTWTATDFCGNIATDNQTITVLDQTKPEIFQVYTLENGSKLAAGVAQRVTHDWKYIHFPITFKSTPVVLAQVATNSDGAAITAYLRNVSMQGFEIRVKEEELADGQHGIENVAWIAVDPGTGDGAMKWEASTFANVSHQLDTINFALDYTEAPIFLSSMMTTRQTDPATLRHNALTVQSVEIFAQEEASADVEVDRVNETVGFMAIEPNMQLVDELGEVFGETGKLQLTNAWATVNLTRNYTKPVVIVGSLTNQDGQPVTVRVRNIANNKFQARLQEWDYLDGNHDSENVSWMVVEGSIPGDAGYYCSGQAVNLKPNVNVFVVDNCDDLVSFGFTESSSQGITGLTTTRTWTGIDDCGNTTLVSRYDTCVVAAVQLKAMLYGAIFGNGGSSTMRDNLREKDFVPLEQPYSALPGFPNIDYEIIDPNGGLGNGNPTEQMVTICHKSGTPGEATLSVPLSEVAYYISLGDYVGECGVSNPEFVTICHEPGTSAQKTMVIKQNSLLKYLSQGDAIGACSGTGNELPTSAANANYRTIADGLWSDAATWQGGSVPPTSNISNKTISIEHNVTLQNANLNLADNAFLYVTGGSLTLHNGNFDIEKGSVVFERSVFDCSTAGNVKLKNAESRLSFKNCTVLADQNLENDGGKIRMEYVNLTVGGNYKNSGGTDTLLHVCALIEEDFTNSSGGKLFFQNSNIRLPNGSFQNNALCTVAGDISALLVEKGSLENLGIWTAPLGNYCVSGLLSLPISALPVVGDCSNIANVFNPCDCFGSTGGTSNLGSGNAEVVSTVSNVLMNPGKSLGDGKIEAAMLEITGEEAAVDWMLVELRDPDNAAEVLGYSAVILQRDGDVVNEDGDSVIVFPGLDDGDYYVSIRHRNHLGIITNAPVNLTINDPLLVDFSDPNLPVKGGSLAGRSVNGKRTMWGGDFNEDGKIIYQGPYNDVFYLFSRVVADENNITNLANYIVPGYDSNDFNLDGMVIYQGPYNDRGLLLFNSILAHAGNGSLLANYIVLDLIP